MSKAYGLAQPREGPWSYEDMIEDVQRVLIIVAHPDDIDHGRAGTVARMTAAGINVHQLIITKGGAGGHDPHQSHEELVAIRVRESHAAAEVLGCSCHLLNYPDGMVLDSAELRRDIAREIRIERPDLMMTMTPSPLVGGTFINHPDHRVVAQLTMDNVVTGGPTALVFPELLDEELLPHKPSRLALFGPIGGGALGANLMGDIPPNCCVDITETFEQKKAALAAHASQVEDRDLDDFVRWISEAAARNETFQYGESFHVLDAFP